LKKIEEHLSANQLSWSSVVKMTVFLTDAAYLAAVRTAFTTILAENKPAMSLVIVAGLVAPEFKVEIEAQATLA
jgi:enamine deaminase RidA (YjgF/YER057c/UK114 family)